jgi:hypothetical protein
MGPATVNPDDPYIRRFRDPTNEYKVIFVDFKTDEYNLNIFVGTDEFKIPDEETSFSCSVIKVEPRLQGVTVGVILHL